MTMLNRALYAEWLKTRRTLAFTLIFMTPLAIVVLSTLNFLRASAFFFSEDIAAWEWLIRNTFGLWALLLLPLFIALQAALLAGLEHQNGGWKHLFSLSVPRWSIYAAKQIMVLLIVGASHLFLVLGVLTSGALLQLFNIRPEISFGTIPWDEFLMSAIVMYIGTWLMIVIHSWIAMRWQQFTVAIGVALVALVAGFMIANVDLGILFPWSMPILSIATIFDNQGEGLFTILVLNVVGLVALTPIVCWDVIRRDVV